MQKEASSFSPQCYSYPTLYFFQTLTHTENVYQFSIFECAKRRLISAWASAQSDQSLRSELSGLLRTQAFFMRIAKGLIRLGGCPGWSESSLGAHSFCWIIMSRLIYSEIFDGKNPHMQEIYIYNWKSHIFMHVTFSYKSRNDYYMYYNFVLVLKQQNHSYRRTKITYLRETSLMQTEGILVFVVFTAL